MEDLSPSDQQHVGHDTARRLVHRALQLQEQQSDLVSLRDLRSAASELGVSVDAFDTALSELEEREQLSRLRALPPLHAATLGVAVGSGAAVALAIAPMTPAVVLLATAALVMSSGIVAVRNHAGGSLGSFLASNTALWSAFTASLFGFTAWAQTHHMSYGLIFSVQPFVALWGATSVLGALVANFRVTRPGDGETSPSLLDRARRALASRLRRISDRLDSRFRSTALIG